MTNRLLYIAYLFPPVGGGGVQRPSQTVNLLTEKNWQVTVLTDDIEAYNYDVFDWRLLNSIDPRVKIYRPRTGTGPIEGSKATKKNNVAPATGKTTAPRARLKRWLTSKKPFLKRLFISLLHVAPDTLISWVIRCWQRRSSIASQGPFDLVFASVRPASSLLLGWLLARYMGIPLVVEYRDLWNGQEFNEPQLLPTKAWFDQWLEHRMLRDCARIIVVTPAYKRILSERYPDIGHKIEVYTNGYPEEISTSDTSAIPENEKLTIRHVGRIYGKRDISGLLEALEGLLQDGVITEDEISIEFIGPPLSPLQQNQFEESRCKSVLKQPGYVTFEEAIALQKSADLLLLVETTKDVYPGKVFEYLAMRRPVLGILGRGGVLWELLEEAGDHLLVPYDDPLAIRHCLEEAITHWRNGNLKLEAINETLVASFSRRHITNAMSQEFQQVIQQHQSSLSLQISK